MTQHVVLMDKIFDGMPATPEEADGPEVVHLFFERLKLYGRCSFVPAGRAIRLHVHTYDHDAAIVRGQGTLITDEEKREVKEGDVITVRKGMRHAYVAERDTIWLCVHRTTEEEAKKLYGVKW